MTIKSIFTVIELLLDKTFENIVKNLSFFKNQMKTHLEFYVCIIRQV